MSEAAPEDRPGAGEDPARPTYKGAPLEADRGPGLGCFWLQVVVLVALLVATPMSVWLVAPPWLSAALLIITLVLLFFVGQTSIFLLRLVAADRRAQRRPLRPGARPTVGQLSGDADHGAAERAEQRAAERAQRENQSDKDDA